jgi:hypothetical protein
MGWSNLLGQPTDQRLVVIAVSPETTFHFADGSAHAVQGAYFWSSPHTGRWHIAYGLPLAVLMAGALLPVRRWCSHFGSNLSLTREDTGRRSV